MPRLPRYITIEEGFQVHKIWRGHNREWNLKSDSEKNKYLELLIEEQLKLKINQLHALCIMSNHVHEVYTLNNRNEFSKLMQKHHGRYAMYFNRKHKRCGKIAQDRPNVIQIQDDEHEMLVVFYIHANPLRAGIKKDAKDYIWSTHMLYAFGIKPPWFNEKVLVFPQWYMNLGDTMQLRQKRYRMLFARYLKRDGLIKKEFRQFGFGSHLWQELRRANMIARYIEIKQKASPPN